MAKLSGFDPIVTTASIKNAAALKELGAKHVVDRMRPEKEIAAEIQKLIKKPLKSVFDCISSAETQHLVLDAVESQGKVALVVEPVKNLKTGDKSLFQIFGLASTPQNAKICGKLFHDLAEEMIEHKFIRVRFVQTE